MVFIEELAVFEVGFEPKAFIGTGALLGVEEAECGVIDVPCEILWTVGICIRWRG